ncbi:alpha/beta fold hydrolase [Pseudonocardia sp. D17]|uniref:alpha/beta fold hydrolase n=1 Tax=Pseudonocardia sp. D17 TaxID=882661 RepID=UPI002B385461|nr:alpha/beta hydrolase [Pseudonocardia sp. D17]
MTGSDRPADTWVLVPGAGGEAWYWHLVVPELQRRGYAAVAVDLPAGDESAGVDEYADVVVAALAAHRERTGGGGRTFVVAQPMGGLTAPLVCARTRVDLLVLLNAMIPQPGEVPGDWWETSGFREARRAQACRDGWDIEDLFEAFMHDVPADVRAEAVRRGEPDQTGAPFASAWPLDRWPDVPTRFLQARDDRFFPVDFQRAQVAQRLGVPFDEIPGGHLVALSRPVELVDRLESFVGPGRPGGADPGSG